MTTPTREFSKRPPDLLLLAKIQNQQFNNSVLINLKVKIEEKIVQFQELWQSNKVSVQYQLKQSCILMSPELLDILLNNLFSNASNHNVPSGDIVIELEQHQLIISNTGSSTALDENRLFTRFYKESANSNHNGLGLSIVHQISKVSEINITYQFTNKKHQFILTW